MEAQYFNNEQLFQQRLNERMNNQQTQDHQIHDSRHVDLSTLPTPTVNTVLSNPHPAQVMQFVNSDYNTKLNIAQANPQLYAQIYNHLLKKQQDTQQTTSNYIVPEVSTYPGHTYSNQSEPKMSLEPQQVVYPHENNDYEDESSELSNHHSSDDELNDVQQPPQQKVVQPTSQPKRHTIPMNAAPKKKLISANTRNKLVSIQKSTVHNVLETTTKQTLFLPLDFRRDLYEITNQNEYVLSFPKKHNVSQLTLTNCVISCNDMLLNEPYIYVKLNEVSGSYELTGEKDITVFGKLVQDKTMNGFIFYSPENCTYTFDEPKRLNKLTFSFLNYNLEPISLTDLNVKTVKKSKNFLKVITNGDHCLRSGNDVSVCYETRDRRSIEKLDVVEMSGSNSLILNKPSEMNLVGNCLSFSVMNVKCAITIQLTI